MASIHKTVSGKEGMPAVGNSIPRTRIVIDEREKKSFIWHVRLRERLKELLQERQLTARQLSIKSGIGNNIMYGILNGRTAPTLYTIQHLADALDTSLVNLLGLEQNADSLKIIGPLATQETLMPLPQKAIAKTGFFSSFRSTFDNEIVAERCLAFPNAPHFYVLVDDESMTLGRPALQVGGMALCVSMEGNDEIRIINGREYVIARRAPMDDDLAEIIVRKVLIYQDRVELVACSHLPADRFPRIVHRGRLTNDSSEKLFAFGYVYGFMQIMD
jgi:transcriptional regulator with XRE-family HTH domain